MLFLVFFFFKQKTAYEMRISDWSSDVCSSDLDDVLRQIARDIGRRAIDLGRILARKRAAAVRGGAAIGIDDDLAPGDAGVAVRPADLEQPSVVLTIEGTTLREDVVVLGAHLDSINAYGGGSPGQAAPGADDAASGLPTVGRTAGW